MGCPDRHEQTILAGIDFMRLRTKSRSNRRLHIATLDFLLKNNQMAASFHLPAAA